MDWGAEGFWQDRLLKLGKERWRQASRDRVEYQSPLKYQTRIVAKNVHAADLEKAYGYVILRPDDVVKNNYVECTS